MWTSYLACRWGCISATCGNVQEAWCQSRCQREWTSITIWVRSETYNGPHGGPVFKTTRNVVWKVKARDKWVLFYVCYLCIASGVLKAYASLSANPCLCDSDKDSVAVLAWFGLISHCWKRLNIFHDSPKPLLFRRISDYKWDRICIALHSGVIHVRHQKGGGGGVTANKEGKKLDISSVCFEYSR